LSGTDRNLYKAMTFTERQSETQICNHAGNRRGKDAVLREGLGTLLKEPCILFFANKISPAFPKGHIYLFKSAEVLPQPSEYILPLNKNTSK